jgi:hypothetical protein
MEAELFHADGQPDMTKLTVAFRNFGKAPKIGNALKLTEFLGKGGSSTDVVTALAPTSSSSFITLVTSVQV